MGFWAKVKRGFEYYTDPDRIEGGIKYYGERLDKFGKKVVNLFADDDANPNPVVDSIHAAPCFDLIKASDIIMIDRRSQEVLNNPAEEQGISIPDENPLEYCLEQYSLLGYGQQDAGLHVDEL